MDYNVVLILYIVVILYKEQHCHYLCYDAEDIIMVKLKHDD